MLRSRIIPMLLLSNNALVKTINFQGSKYIGDPMNAVRIFNEKEADELIVADIDSSKHNIEPNFELIKNLARECRMPLCYAGGINSVKVIEKIISLGVEKVALGSYAVKNLDLITEAQKRLGSQSIVVVLDVKKVISTNHYSIFIKNGTIDTKLDPVEIAKHAEESGAGEILINSIDNDGLMAGYDVEIIQKIKSVLNIPMTVVGGAGNLSHLETVIKSFNPIGVCAGSLFVFKGKFKAVLINYPSKDIKNKIFESVNI
jgi:imidazole glycerol-phosphate synthase subunit HisF